MTRVTTFSALAFALATLPVDAYFRMVCSTIQTGRIDPIVSPGQVASHVHKISGGSSIALNSTYEDLRNSACTSCQNTADKSAYWTPQLYYQHPNGSFEEVPNGGTVAYYLGRGDNKTLTSFPAGFKMLSGDTTARSFNNTAMTYSNGPRHPGRPIADRVSSHAWRILIHFQSCWDGKNAYLPNNKHVDYMSQIDNGICSPAYPVPLIHVFFELLYGVNNVDQSDGGRFVFANGDRSGFGFHGDFLMGWEPTLLQAAIDQCGLSGDNEISTCPVLAPTDTSTYGENCPEYAPFGKPLVAETVHGLIGTKLPGCINIVTGPAPAQTSDYICPPGVPLPTVENFPPQTPTIYLDPKPGQAVGLSGWKYVGCYKDLVDGSTRVLSGGSQTSASNTIESCQTFCSNKGWGFSGVEYGTQCFCSSAIGSSLPGLANCTQVCAGNGTELCGAAGYISIYNNTAANAGSPTGPGHGPTPVAAGKYAGCATEGTNGGRVFSGPSYSSGNAMTLEACRSFCDTAGFFYSGTEYASECYCGNTMANGGALLLSNSTCNTVCSGSNAETCGGPSRLSVFNSTKISLPTSPASVGNYSFSGCWVDNTNNVRALNGATYSNSTGMTVETCVAYCEGKSYSIAGLEYSSQCYCGPSLASGAAAPASDCGNICTGKQTELCGGAARLSLYRRKAV